MSRLRRYVGESGVPLDNGVSSPISIDSPFDHVSVWSRIQNQVPALSSLGYEEVPRGRVLFLKRTKQFVVYLDKVLAVAAVKKAILKEFNLPAKATRFKTDPHYMTNRAELDRLFRAD